MTSTPVKDLGSALMNLTVSQTGKGALGAGGFQKVWNSQMNKGTADGSVQSNAKSQTSRQVQKGSSLKAKENRTAQDSTSKTSESLSAEEQEQAVEVLGAAALELMEQIMDVFGISMEELQSVMGELGMEQTDVLDASMLNTLLMRLGGAEDPYALVTDGELYENYRMLMDQRSTILSESAQAFGTDPEQLLGLLKEGSGEEAEMYPSEVLPAVQEAVKPVTVVDHIHENVNQSEEEMPDAEGALSVGTVEQAAGEGQEAQGMQEQAGGRQDGEKHFDGKAEKGQQVNPFVQNLGTQQYQPGLEQTEGVGHSSPWSADTQEIMNQILDHMKLQLNADTTSLEMQLHPASLGTLQVQIASKGGMLTANFITQNEAVKAALETQMIQLKAQFEEQGIKVEAIEVTVQTHEFERNLDEQGRGRGQQEQASGRRNRTRRIDLNDPLGMELTEEEDMLAADMMAVDGSTVNYTV